MDADAAGTEGPGEDAPPPAATAAGQGLTLIERRGAATWLGCTGDGATVICERVTLPPQARDVDGRFLRQRAAAVLTTSQPELLPVRRIVRKGGIIWMLSDVDDGVPLHRLLDRAKPSLAEAASLAALVLEAVAAMHGAGYVHGGLDSRSVRLGPGGGVRVAGWGPNALFPAELDGDGRRADLRATAGILAEIARSAGRPGRPLTETEEKLAARLASVADPRSLARRSPLKAAQGLDVAVGSPERRRAARQGLVDLARAVAAADAPIPTGDAARGARSSGGTGRAGTGLAPGITGAGPAVTAPPGRSLPPPARRRPIWPRIWKGAAIGAVVAVVLGAELRFFGDSVQHNVNVLLSGNVRPAVAGPRRPAALPVLGPATAGPITHVELRPLDGCRAGAVCNVLVQVTVKPQDRPLEVAWSLELFDRCRPGRDPGPGGVMTIAPGRDRAVQTAAVPLPPVQALAVIPLTSSPAAVAGAPMRLSADDGPC